MAPGSVRQRPLAVFGLLAVATLVGLLMFLREPQPVDSDVAEKGRALPSGPLPASESSARSPESLAATTIQAVLRVRATDRDRPAQGRVSFCQRSTTEGLFDGLAEGFLGQTADDPEAKHADMVDGSAVLELQPDCWTFLRLQTDRQSVCFERIPPFRGERSLLLACPRAPVVHVHVVGADWRSPVPNARLRCVEVAMTALEVGEGREVVCDQGGYARVESTGPGRLILIADGARPEDGAPFAVPVVLRQGQPDLNVVLVQLPKRATLELDTLVDLGDWNGPAPKLVMERVSDQSAALLPQRGVLAQGRQSVSFELSPGGYRVRVLPAGALRVTGGEYVDVTAPLTRQGLTLARNTANVRVKLNGLSLADFPLRVLAVPNDGLRKADLDNEFYGPFHWHGPELTVPALSGEVVFQAFGRHGCFLSGPVNMSRNAVEVDLHPASRIEVHWSGEVLGARDQPVLIAKTAHEEVATTFVRKLIDGVGARRPGWVASLVLRKGDAVLAGQVGSTECWSQSVQLERRHQLLRL